MFKNFENLVMKSNESEIMFRRFYQNTILKSYLITFSQNSCKSKPKILMELQFILYH